ncbi:MAG: KpsF/GutQ family sugar-phosphate isomerase [bacterium]|nr:KpsF/GutQ family sugar-phosphate isomerase [bacterium]
MFSTQPSASVLLDECRRVIQIEAQAINALTSRLGENVTKALDLMEACNKRNGHVILTGMGKSGLVARKIAATLSSTGTPSLYLHPVEAIHGDVGVVSPYDLAIVISKSGRTDELSTLLPAFRLLGIPVIGLLGDPKSPLAERCDLVIDVSVAEEACPWDLAPTASTTAALVMGDVLAIALLHKRGFTKEDFALLHPGGTLGRRLLLKVDSVMRKGDEIPKVPLHASLKELIVEMTSKRLGATCVVDDNGRLLGIITDGDLRRLLEREADLSKITAADCLTLNPKTIHPETIATRAIHLMESHNITQLIVLNEMSELVGIVHLHDLLQVGIT